MKNYPMYRSQADVACFNCSANLADAAQQDSGYTPRRGEFKKECPRCGMKTWYDLKGGAK